MPKKRASSLDASRLKVLAAGDEAAFVAHAIELLASGDRLAREAALEALVERPLPAARAALRALYLELDADGLKRDQGGSMRAMIVRILTKIADVRDVEIGVRACDTFEEAFGEDISWQLRTYGLRMLADLEAALFPFYAAEHLDDRSLTTSEPANTAFQLLAGTGHYVPIYQWLLSAADRDPALVAAVVELMASGPRAIVERYVITAAETAARRSDEALCIALAETIVKLEVERAYPALARIMSSKIGEELYNYLAVLLAGTNRPPLLTILEEQLHSGRRPKVVAAALRIRPNPEQERILQRWEDGAEFGG